VPGVQERVVGLSRGVDKLLHGKRDQDHQAMLDRLSMDPSKSHDAACAKHEQSTGTWFIESDTFVSWWSFVNQKLWLHGIPGCGKTVLCSTIIEHVKSLKANIPDIGIAYFYFDFRDREKQNVKGLLRSMLAQLCCQSPAFPSVIKEIYD
jgi:hypothetical protein